MVSLNTDKTVRDLALEDPRLREALESLGIDTCCGGGKPLGEAVRAAGLDMDTVRERLNQAAAEAGSEPADKQKRDWRQASLAELADHIEETHHAFLREVLPRISERFGKVMKAHGENHGDMLRDVLLSNFDDPAERVQLDLSNLPVGENTVMEQSVIDDGHAALHLESAERIDAAPRSLAFALPRHTVRLIIFRPASICTEGLFISTTQNSPFDKS